MEKEVKLNKFTAQMETVLEDNCDKLHWSNLSQDILNFQLKKVQQKLHNAVCKNDHKSVRKHSIDLANYSYFLYDNSLKLQGNRFE